MRKILGVNYTDKVLDASVIDYRLWTSKPVKTESAPMPDDREKQDIAFRDFLKSWKDHYATEGVVLGLPLKYFLCQSIDMPLMGRADMIRALTFELEKYLPLPVDEYMYDFIAISSEKNRQKVLVFAVRKEVVSAFISSVKESGLDILSIRCNMLGAFSGFLEVVGEKNINGLFVNVTGDSYEIAGLSDSLPVFARSYPGDIDIHVILEDLSLKYQGKIYITGIMDTSVSEKFNSRKFQISVSNSLACSAVKKSNVNPDFLPQEYARPKKDYYPYLLGGLASATVLLFLLTGMTRFYKDLTTQRSLEKKIAAIKEKASHLLETQKKLDLLQNDRKLLLNFQGRSNTAIRVLSDLSRILPKDAWLVNFSVDDKGKIEIEGFAKKTSQLIIDLENSNSFKNVSLSSPVVAKDSEERFSVKMEVEGL